MTRRKAVPIAKSPITWILVADSRQAQVYTRKKEKKQKNDVRERERERERESQGISEIG